MLKPHVSLRDSLLSTVSLLPNPHTLHLTVLTSTPKRTTALYPHAPSSGVRCLETEYFVVLASDLPQSSTPADPVAPSAEPTAASTSTPSSGLPATTVLTSAISAHLYTLPQSTGSQATSILYISKVDSSGYAPPSSPSLTRELVVAFLSYFVDPATRPTPRVVVTLFARSQGQYLFPNSIEGGRKRVLGGLGLCSWWRGVYQQVVSRLVAKTSEKAANVSLTYLLPSYSAQEAVGMLGASRSSLPPGVQWTYSPPFLSPLLPGKPEGAHSLATLIPSLPDDPKTRFLEELVADALELGSSSAVKTSGLSATEIEQRKKKSRKERGAAEEEQDRKRANAALAKVAPGEFWERMGFRQECSSGDVTGFFTLTVESDIVAFPLIPVAAAATTEADDRITTSTTVKDHEHATSTTTTTQPHPLELEDRTNDKSIDTPSQLPQAIVERILTSLLNTDFGSRDFALSGTKQWNASTRAVVLDEIGEAGWDASTAIVPAKQGVLTPTTDKRKEETVVTMLQPRKKKKVE